MSTICQWAGFAHPRWAFVAPHLSGASAQVEWLADTVGIDAALARRAAAEDEGHSPGAVSRSADLLLRERAPSPPAESAHALPVLSLGGEWRQLQDELLERGPTDAARGDAQEAVAGIARGADARQPPALYPKFALLRERDRPESLVSAAERDIAAAADLALAPDATPEQPAGGAAGDADAKGATATGARSAALKRRAATPTRRASTRIAADGNAERAISEASASGDALLAELLSLQRILRRTEAAAVPHAARAVAAVEHERATSERRKRLRETNGEADAEGDFLVEPADETAASEAERADGATDARTTEAQRRACATPLNGAARQLEARWVSMLLAQRHAADSARATGERCCHHCGMPGLELDDERSGGEEQPRPPGAVAGDAPSDEPPAPPGDETTAHSERSQFSAEPSSLVDQPAAALAAARARAAALLRNALPRMPKPDESASAWLPRVCADGIQRAPLISCTGHAFLNAYLGEACGEQQGRGPDGARAAARDAVDDAPSLPELPGRPATHLPPSLVMDGDALLQRMPSGELPGAITPVSMQLTRLREAASFFLRDRPTCGTAWCAECLKSVYATDAVHVARHQRGEPSAVAAGRPDESAPDHQPADGSEAATGSATGQPQDDVDGAPRGWFCPVCRTACACDACGWAQRAPLLSHVWLGEDLNKVRVFREGILRNARRDSQHWCVCVFFNNAQARVRLSGGVRSGGGDRVGTHRRNGGLPFDARTGLSIPLMLSEQRSSPDDGATASPGGLRSLSAWPSGLGMSAEGMTPRPGSAGVSFLGSPARLPGMADPTTEESAGGVMRTRGRALSLSLGGSPAHAARAMHDRAGGARGRLRSVSHGASFDSLADDDAGSDGEAPSKRARRASSVGGDSSVGGRADRGRDAIDLSGRVKLADAARALGVRKPNAPLLFRPILTAGLRPPRWLNACVGAAARSRLPAPLRS